MMTTSTNTPIEHAIGSPTSDQDFAVDQADEIGDMQQEIANDPGHNGMNHHEDHDEGPDTADNIGMDVQNESNCVKTEPESELDTAEQNDTTTEDEEVDGEPCEHGEDYDPSIVPKQEFNGDDGHEGNTNNDNNDDNRNEGTEPDINDNSVWKLPADRVDCTIEEIRRGQLINKTAENECPVLGCGRKINEGYSYSAPGTIASGLRTHVLFVHYVNTKKPTRKRKFLAWSSRRRSSSTPKKSTAAVSLLNSSQTIGQRTNESSTSPSKQQPTAVNSADQLETATSNINSNSNSITNKKTTNSNDTDQQIGVSTDVKSELTAGVDGNIRKQSTTSPMTNGASSSDKMSSKRISSSTVSALSSVVGQKMTQAALANNESSGTALRKIVTSQFNLRKLVSGAGKCSSLANLQQQVTGSPTSSLQQHARASTSLLSHHSSSTPNETNAEPRSKRPRRQVNSCVQSLNSAAGYPSPDHSLGVSPIRERPSSNYQNTPLTSSGPLEDSPLSRALSGGKHSMADTRTPVSVGDTGSLYSALSNLMQQVPNNSNNSNNSNNGNNNGNNNNHGNNNHSNNNNNSSHNNISNNKRSPMGARHSLAPSSAGGSSALKTTLLGPVANSRDSRSQFAHKNNNLADEFDGSFYTLNDPSSSSASLHNNVLQPPVSSTSFDLGPALNLLLQICCQKLNANVSSSALDEARKVVEKFTISLISSSQTIADHYVGSIESTLDQPSRPEIDPSDVLLAYKILQKSHSPP